MRRSAKFFHRKRNIALLSLPILAFLALIAIVVAASMVPTTSAVAVSSVPRPNVTQVLAPPVAHAPNAVLIDSDSGDLLFSSNPDQRRAIASTTKIMTATLVLESLPLDKVVTVSPTAASVGQQSLGLEPGDKLTVEQLLYGALVHSGNDASCALAEATSGSIKAFVDQMNAKARKLGLKNTHFTNPDGLDEVGHYSSARDLAVLARYAMRNSEFQKIVGTANYSLTLPGRSAPFSFHNVNRLVRTVDWVTGIKTGSTSNARFCLVASGSRNGASVISVVLGESNWTNTWADSKLLLEYGFRREQMPDAPSGVSLEGCSSVASVTLNKPSTVVAHATIPCRTGGSISLATAGSGTTAITVPAGTKIGTAVELPKTVSTPIKQGDILGHVVYTANGRALVSLDIVAAQTIPRPALTTRMAYCCNWLRHKIASSF